MCCLPWAYAEVVRFTYYALKQLEFKEVENGVFALVGWLRYNSFQIMYPLGISGEMLCVYNAWTYLTTLDYDKRPYTVLLPNKLNFGFQFTMVLSIFVPLIYTMFTPTLFGHMLVQKNKYSA
jgi:very-long-chain (3R)-3-hydroxyacyl-CoA dehydratase